LASVPSLGTPSSVIVPPQSSIAIPWRTRAGWPTHSKTWSTPSGRPRSRTATTGSSTALASTKSVAPRRRAISSLAGLASTATMRPAAAMRAPWMTDWPMPPAPTTSTVWPGRTRARLSTAPTPVTTAQPTRQATSSGTSRSMTTACVSATTTASVNTPVLAKANARSPPTVNGRPSRPIVSRQWVGWPRSQAAHRPQLPSVVRTTWSPTDTLVTASPTASTTPAPSWPRTTGVGNGIVPSITETSLWHSPAWWMRTRTSCGRGSRTSTSSRTSSSPVQTMPFMAVSPSRWPSSPRPHDRLQLAVGVQGEAAPVAPDARPLEPAEGRLGALLDGVERHRPRPQPAGDAQRLRRVAGEDVVVEAELGAVGQGDGLVLVVEGQRHDDGPEDLLLHDPHLGLAVGDERRRDVEAAGQVGPLAAGEQRAALVDAGPDVALDAVALGGRDDRADDRVGGQRVADLQP